MEAGVMATLHNTEYTKTDADGVVRTLVAYSPADQVRLEFNGWARRVEEPAAAPLQAPHPPPNPEESPDEVPVDEGDPADGEDTAAQVQAPSRTRH